MPVPPALTAAEPLSQLPASPALPTPLRALGIVVVLAILTLFLGLAHQYGFDAYLKLSQPGLSEAARELAIQEYFSSPFGAALFYSLQFLLIMPTLHYAADFPSQPWQQTIALHKVPLTSIGHWLGIWFVTMTAVVIALSLVEQPEESFMTMMLSKPHWLMLVATVVLAPLMEETLFRGYLFRAVSNTRLGTPGAVLLTSILFTAMHGMQYSMYGMLQIFSLALVLGLARARTGSLLTPLVIHITQNTLANLAPLLGEWLGP